MRRVRWCLFHKIASRFIVRNFMANCKRQFSEKPISTFVNGVFKIKRHHSSLWRNLENMNAGFECFIEIDSVTFLPPIIINAEEIGIVPDFSLTQQLYFSSFS